MSQRTCTLFILGLFDYLDKKLFYVAANEVGTVSMETGVALIYRVFDCCASSIQMCHTRGLSGSF